MQAKLKQQLANLLVKTAKPIDSIPEMIYKQGQLQVIEIICNWLVSMTKNRFVQLVCNWCHLYAPKSVDRYYIIDRLEY